MYGEEAPKSSLVRTEGITRGNSQEIQHSIIQTQCITVVPSRKLGQAERLREGYLNRTHTHPRNIQIETYAGQCQLQKTGETNNVLKDHNTNSQVGLKNSDFVQCLDNSVKHLNQA